MKVTKALNSIISVFSIVLLRYSFGFFTKQGILRDEHNISTDALGLLGVIILFAAAALTVVLVANLSLIFIKKPKNNKVIIVISFFVLSLSLIIGIKAHSELEKLVPAPAVIKNVTLEDLVVFLEDSESGIFYIKRDDCLYCQQMDETISSLALPSETVIYCYSTSADRTNNSVRLSEILKQIEVVSVPSLVEIENGKIKEVCTSNNAKDIRALLIV